MFYYHEQGILCGFLVFHVDDSLSGGNYDFIEDIIKPLRQKYNFGQVSKGSFSFTGLNIHQNRDFEIFVEQRDFIKKMNIYDYKKEENGHILDKSENR